MELPPLTRVQGVHRNSSLYHMNDGFFFTRCNQRLDTIYFRCSKSGSGCHATAALRSGCFQSSLEHNHPPNFLHVPVTLERRRLVNEASNLQYASFAEIFTNTSNLFPHLLTPHSLQPAMARMRSFALPQEPSTLPGLDLILRDARFRCLCSTSYFEDFIYSGSTVSEDGCFAILLLSGKCKEFMRHSITPFTFTTPFTMQGAPAQYWVHVIYTVWDGTFLILAWLLMEQITDQGFTAALTLLKSVLEVKHFNTIVCQLGSKEANAYKAVFAPVHVTFCLHDFVQNVGNYIRSENLNHPHLVDIASLVCALPILPSDFLHFGRAYIQQQMQNFEGLADQANMLLEHVQSNWFNVVADFSVSGDSYRTSNVNETVQRRVLQDMNTHKTSIYSLIRHIASAAELSGRDILELQHGRKVQRRRTVSLSNEKEIAVLTMALVHPFGSAMTAVINLLHATSTATRHILLNQLGQ